MAAGPRQDQTGQQKFGSPCQFLGCDPSLGRNLAHHFAIARALAASELG